MPLIKQLFTIFVLGFLAISVKSQTSETNQRNLDDYDKIRLDVPVIENPRSANIKVRDFVWKHWKQKDLGYAIITLRSKEGDPTTSHIFIEPDGAGVWRVAIRSESEFHNRGILSDPKKATETIYQTRSYEAYGVERVKIKGNYLLRLKDKNGNVIAER
ncbi:MAG: hypothetical protein H0X15_05670 [Acidobacteria bacterium]|jgi:hypothetical protein|nr:hypothetical protein [Acidobacteriota bacterium]MBA4122633.1 hypothetical protein [Acidobacteriota bacterium]